jgi:hypothetical protein
MVMALPSDGTSTVAGAEPDEAVVRAEAVDMVSVGGEKEIGSWL